MAGELLTGLSIFKALYDSAKALKDINDATVRNTAVIELSEKILAAREAQATLLDRIRELEEKVSSFETWESEKQRYDLKNLGYGAFAYMLQPGMRGTEPPYWACTNCYGNRRISIIQHTTMKRGEGFGWFCPACKSEIKPSPEACNGDNAKWLD